MLSYVLLWPFTRLHIWRAPGALGSPATAVVVANHISHFDPFLLSYAFPRPIDWMTTEEFYSNPLMRTWLRALNTVPVDRSRPDHRALRVGVERLRAGRIVGVFPEGGIRAGATSILGGASLVFRLFRLSSSVRIGCMLRAVGCPGLHVPRSGSRSAHPSRYRTRAAVRLMRVLSKPCAKLARRRSRILL